MQWGEAAFSVIEGLLTVFRIQSGYWVVSCDRMLVLSLRIKHISVMPGHYRTHNELIQLMLMASLSGN